jgi:hypothetical protein
LDTALELRDVVGIDVPEKEFDAKAANVDTERLFNTGRLFAPPDNEQNSSTVYFPEDFPRSKLAEDFR